MEPRDLTSFLSLEVSTLLLQPSWKDIALTLIGSSAFVKYRVTADFLIVAFAFCLAKKFP